MCPTDKLPPNVTHTEHGWKALKIQGELDFSLIGIIADISRLLAENNISIFVVSTYNTDYILVKAENYKQAIDILKSNNYNIYLN